jgi:hypothetical protein
VEGNFGGKNYGWEMSLMSCEGGRILTKNYLSFKSLSFFFFFFFSKTRHMLHVPRHR